MRIWGVYPVYFNNFVPFSYSSWLGQLFKQLRLNCKAITSLDICDNFVRGSATSELVLMLKECLNLKNLNLSDCLNEGENEMVIEGFEVNHRFNNKH